MNKDEFKILVVDDEEGMREGLEKALLLEGSVMVTLVPLSSELATSIVPRCFSTISLHNESPRPMLGWALLVKNGSNIFCTTDGCIPLPLSVMSTSKALLLLLNVTLRLP